MKSIVRVLSAALVIAAALVVASPAARPATAGSGYWMITADGHVHAFGAAHLGQPVGPARSDIEATPSGQGYWVLAEDGGLFTYGDARFFGRPAAPGRYVSLSATPTGGGYWVFTDTGQAFAYGDAARFGDMAGKPLNGPVLDSVATPSGRGYWMSAKPRARSGGLRGNGAKTAGNCSTNGG